MRGKSHQRLRIRQAASTRPGMRALLPASGPSSRSVATSQKPVAVLSTARLRPGPLNPSIHSLKIHPAIAAQFSFPVTMESEPNLTRQEPSHAGPHPGFVTHAIPELLPHLVPRSLLPLSSFVWISLRTTPIIRYLYRHVPLQPRTSRVFASRE